VPQEISSNGLISNPASMRPEMRQKQTDRAFPAIPLIQEPFWQTLLQVQPCGHTLGVLLYISNKYKAYKHQYM